MISAWDSAVSEEVHGIFFSTPGVTLFPGSLTDLGTCREKFIARSQGGAVEYLITDLLVNESSLEGVAPILTRSHELCHYMQLTSTTFGLALWQAEVAMCDILFERVGDASDRDISAQVGNARAVYDFVLALRERQALTMSEFLEVANRAQKVISVQWGLPVRRWVARDSSLASYLPEELSEPLEVVEGAARIAELLQLQGERMNLPEWLMEEWNSTRLFGPYEKVVREMRSAVGNLRVSSQLCDLALLGDLASSVKAGGTSIVAEEVLPGWRLKSLLNGVREELLPWEPEDLTAFMYADLPKRAGLPTLSETWSVYDRGVKNLGDRALRRREVGSLDDTQYHRWVLRRYARGFRYRRKGNAVHPLPDSASFGARMYKEGGFHPFLEFYGDGMMWNGVEMNRHPELALKCYFELVRTSVVHAILGGGFDLQFLRQVENSLNDRVIGNDALRLSDRGLSVRQIVRSLITNEELVENLNL